MKRTCLLGSLTFCLLATCLSAAAQVGRPPLLPGTISGTVHFKGGVPVPEAVTVYLESEIGEMIDQTSLRGNSRFEFRQVARTRYVVRATAPGYREATNRVDLTLMPAQSTMLTLYAVPDETPGGQRGLGSTEASVPVAALLVPEGAQRELAKGGEALQQNAPEKAVEHFKKAIEIYPEYYQAHLSLGALYMDQQKWAEAEGSLKKSIEINSQYAPSHAALGALYNRTGRAEEAIPELERSLELNPNSWQAHFELAQALLATGKAQEAEPHARRAREMEPKQPLTYLVLGNVLLRQNNLTGAKQEYQSFLEVSPDSPLAGQVREKMAEMDRQMAQPAATQVQASPVPRNAQREFSEGKKSLDQGQLDPALAHFRKATDIYPEFVEAHHMRGTVLLDQQDHAGAEQAFRRSLEINSSYAPSYTGLGTLY
ncbi:MAG: tetratricopeptide repeat protein, partial [Acidobacteria bacterium]|nr:tetratricopeptide repeat protein [Acidobacteriota bacterium]